MAPRVSNHVCDIYLDDLMSDAPQRVIINLTWSTYYYFLSLLLLYYIYKYQEKVFKLFTITDDGSPNWKDTFKKYRNEKDLGKK